jgi:type IV pilus assembly protein PilE
LKKTKVLGFTVIELLIVLAIIGIILTIAIPSYNDYIKRASRTAAESELLELATLQEKIYTNSTPPGYSASVTNPYAGSYGAVNGLGRASGQTNDGKYNITLQRDLSVPAVASVDGDQTYVLLATPVAGSTQAGDGTLSVDQSGRRLWGGVGGKSW